MSVAVDAAGPAASVSLVASMSWTHTPTGTMTGIGVSVGWNLAAGATITAATYGGNAMTAEASGQDGSGQVRSAIYSYTQLAGAQTVAFSFSAAVRAAGNSLTVTGGDTTDTMDNVASNGTGTGLTATSGSCTGTTDGLFIDAVATANSALSLTKAADQTQLFSTNVGGRFFGGSYKAGAASTTTSWTLGASVAWDMQLASFKPAASATVNSGFFALMN